MSIKIYTYENPYELDKTFFWSEIMDYPHLCNSQVLANALKEKYPKLLDSLICPIDNVLVNVYTDWSNNVEKRIAQYIAISSQMEAWQRSEKTKNRESLYASLKHSQGLMLDALRLFVELGIECNQLDRSLVNKEQEVFMALLEKIYQQNTELAKTFAFKVEYTKEEILRSFQQTIKKELLEEEKKESPRKLYIDKLQDLDGKFFVESLSRVVVHGIHQFSPLQLKFITLLDRLGVEVVFLYNYQSKFPEVYSTWNQLYRLFDVDIKHDTLADPYVKYSKSHQLAVSLAQIWSSNDSNDRSNRLRWVQSGQDVQMLRFNDVTEYANYVASFFDEAKQLNDKEPLATMKEQVYSVGRDIHDLLRVYYPDSSGDRHFLSYPIGQFLMGLYRIWDPKAGFIKMDWESIRECIMANVLEQSTDRLRMKLDVFFKYFADIKDFEEFNKRLEVYKIQYEKVVEESTSKKILIRRMVFYAPSFVELEDIERFGSAITQLNEVARQLFAGTEKERFSFVDHFKRLESFIKNEMFRFAEQKEKELIASLLERFDQIATNTDLSGTLRDLSNGLHFYLRQQDKEKPDWIVRNFVQIEGDILRSHTQQDTKVYHFGNLSDRLMNEENGSLPWPLTNEFIQRAYKFVSLEFEVYYSALTDYKKFVQYALFYGLCYNESGVRLSFVSHIGDEEEQQYFPFSLMGIPVVPYSPEYDKVGFPPVPVGVKPSRLGKRFSKEEIASFFLCPYRYFLDFVCRGQIVKDQELILKRYYAGLLVNKVAEGRSKLGGLPQGQLNHRVQNADNDYSDYMPFWHETNDFFDSQLEAKNYLVGHCSNGCDSEHLHRRLLFGKDLFLVSGTEHPYSSYARQLNPSGSYSLGLIWKTGPLDKQLSNDIEKYLGANEPQARPGTWCMSCAHQSLCLKPYQMEFEKEQEEMEGE